MSYQWLHLGNGRSVYRKATDRPSGRSDLPAPGVISDTLDRPLYSGADGKQYTSKAALRASYLPSGNPQGIRYEEVGNEQVPLVRKAPVVDEAGIDASIHRAIQKLS